jgi:hypothetical protein
MVRARLPVLNERPLTRGDCAAGPRPCPYVTCRHHLLVDVAEDGRLYVNRALEARLQWGARWGNPSADVPDTCALDVAERGGITEEEIATILGTTVVRIEQIERRAHARARETEHDFDDVDDLLSEHPDDPYLKYSDMGADELAELTAELRARGKAKK